MVLVLVLDALSSSTSTATAEYEYEKQGKTSTDTPKHPNSATSKANGEELNSATFYSPFGLQSEE